MTLVSSNLISYGLLSAHRSLFFFAYCFFFYLVCLYMWWYCWHHRRACETPTLGTTLHEYMCIAYGGNYINRYGYAFTFSYKQETITVVAEGTRVTKEAHGSDNLYVIWWRFLAGTLGNWNMYNFRLGDGDCCSGGGDPVCQPNERCIPNTRCFHTHIHMIVIACKCARAYTVVYMTGARARTHTIHINQNIHTRTEGAHADTQHSQREHFVQGDTVPLMLLLLLLPWHKRFNPMPFQTSTNTFQRLARVCVLHACMRVDVCVQTGSRQ